MEKSVDEAIKVFNKYVPLTTDLLALFKLLVERVYMQGQMDGFKEFKKINNK